MRAGTGSSVIYVPGIGYVTPVNGDGTTASPAAATKGMARQPMYQAPSTQASPAATGGITSQAGGQASAKNGASTSTTKTPTASTNAGDVQVAGTTDAAGDAGAMGGINSGTALQGGSGASTATGANAGLSTSQGAGYTSSGSKASGSKAAGSGSSGSPGSATGRVPASFSCPSTLRAHPQLHLSHPTLKVSGLYWTARALMLLF